MHNTVLTAAGLNLLEKANAEVQGKIDALGAGWEIVSSSTTGIPYKGGQSAQESGPYHGNTHIMYVITVSLKKLN